ncbi:MAG TPA: hypothetical protein VKA38_06550, partial [Draconibacterium sp.]|nr:hypothetical protein [Draconibacterium sp.]
MAKPILTRNRLILLGIILSFFIIPYLFMTPLLEGKKLLTTDLTQYMGMEKEISNYRKETGKEALWTNSMFCGMPAYLISVKYPGNLFTSEVHSFTRVTYPAGMIIIYLIGFFILLRSLKLNKWLSLIGAFAYAFSSYFIIIIAAGHTSKAYAIGYLPIVAAGTLMVYRGKHFPGFLLFTFGLMLEILATHYQITYYGLILLLIYVVVEFIYSLREKRLAEFVKRSLFLVGGAIIAVGVNFANLYSVYEYSKETVRGPSELTREKQNRTTGLNKDYAVLWSQGIDETLTLLIPDFKGGSTDAHPGRESESYKIMKEHRLNDINENLTRIYLYHGEKPGTAGAIYVGAVIMFLFFVGLFILKGRLKWWLLAVAIISIVMSWGKNIMWLTGFLLDHLPFYNKFRAPDMILVITEFAIPLLAIMALHKIFFGDTDKKELYRGLKWSFIITGGITLFFSIFPGIFDNFHSPLDYIQGKPSSPDWLMAAIYQDRKNLLRDDALRSFILILLSAVLLYFAVYKQKIKSGISIALLG